MEATWKDERFSHVTRDPRFRSVPKRERKVKIDKRFQAMFNDDRFRVKYSVDKKGRPTNKTSDEDLKRFYELSDDSDIQGSDSMSEDDDGKMNETNSKEMTRGAIPGKPLTLKQTQEERLAKPKTIEMRTKKLSDKKTPPKDMKHDVNKKKLKRKQKVDKSDIIRKGSPDMPENETGSDDSSNHGTDSEHVSNEQSEEKNLMKSGREPSGIHSASSDDGESDVGEGPDLARGEGNMSSSDDEDDDVDWGTGKEDGVEHEWGELAKDVPEVTVLGRRLAICNMDWDRIKARDLFVLLSSFKPTGAIIHSVKIYPSDFGSQRMKEENTEGPMKFVESVKKSVNEADENEKDDEGDDYQTERLRRYQLERLKYYYAVLECDSVETANHIYEECDGLEYENSSALLDLRFIPDDMEFDQDPVSVCEEVPDSYKPSSFVTAALSQSKVELTWDETDRDRIDVTTKKFSQDEINELDYKAYLASSSEDEETTDPYGGLVEKSENEEDSDEEDEGKQIQKYKSLVKDLEEAENQKDKRDVEMEITWEPGLRETTEQIVKKKGEKKELSVWDQYLEKKKEKKRMKREEKMKEKAGRRGTTEKDGSSVAKGSEDVEGQVFSDDELPEDLDLNDEYFTSEQQTSKPKDSKRKKKKKQKSQLTEAEKEEQKQKQAELSLLMMDEEDNRQHFSLKKLMKKEKKKKKHNKDQSDKVTEDIFQFNTDDIRFQAMYTSHLYNIDPSVPAFKRTKVMDKIIEEKLKRRNQMEKLVHHGVKNKADGQSLKRTSDVDTDDLSTTSAKINKKGTWEGSLKELSTKGQHVGRSSKEPSVSSLVNSVKRKTKNYYQRNK